MSFYRELETSLAKSNSTQRHSWAATIIAQDISIRDLTPLLKGNAQTCSRFLWLLSDVGIANPEKLMSELPYLFELFTTEFPQYLPSFASFWYYTGVPSENEGAAIDLLFELFLSTDTTVTIKSRALVVLAGLAEKYPALKPELCSCIDAQADKHSADFQKRADRIRRTLTD